MVVTLGNHLLEHGSPVILPKPATATSDVRRATGDGTKKGGSR
jgi:hypothetical protein